MCGSASVLTYTRTGFGAVASPRTSFVVSAGEAAEGGGADGVAAGALPAPITSMRQTSGCRRPRKKEKGDASSSRTAAGAAAAASLSRPLSGAGGGGGTAGPAVAAAFALPAAASPLAIVDCLASVFTSWRDRRVHGRPPPTPRLISPPRPPPTPPPRLPPTLLPAPPRCPVIFSFPFAFFSSSATPGSGASFHPLLLV